jgi:hypothetical protein
MKLLFRITGMVLAFAVTTAALTGGGACASETKPITQAAQAQHDELPTRIRLPRKTRPIRMSFWNPRHQARLSGKMEKCFLIYPIRKTDMS